MQSAAGSLRSAGPSRAVKVDSHTTLWGIGADGLSLSGHYRFKVLKGAVTFCGITLTSSTRDGGSDGDGSWHVVSAPVSPFPYFRPVVSQENASNNNITAELATFASVIQAESSSFPLNVSDLAPQFKSLWHDVQRVENSDHLALEIPRSWTELVGSGTWNRHGPRQFVALGPKNSGKSTLARYLANKLLSISKSGSPNSKIYYLELDPGQPEFTPPGCLGLHLITNYNFSPAYSHPTFQNVVSAHHFGYTNPIENPELYLNMCRDLLATYDAHAVPANDFLVINTSGWTKGMGLDLNLQILSSLDPARTMVAHLGPADFDANMTEVDRIELNGDSSQGISTITTSGFSSSELKLLQTTNYFHQHRAEHLTTLAPFEVKLGVALGGICGIGVIDSAGISLPEDIRICVEGTIVSINVLDDEEAVVDCLSDTVPILTEAETSEIWKKSRCVGLALVQLLTDHSVRLITPLDPGELGLHKKRVVLVRGRLQVPTWELYNRDFPYSPWISTTKPRGTGAAYTKFRRNIKRN